MPSPRQRTVAVSQAYTAHLVCFESAHQGMVFTGLDSRAWPQPARADTPQGATMRKLLHGACGVLTPEKALGPAMHDA